MIVQNAANCLSCGDLIVSKHRHDFVTCTCGAISVDGGQEYLRRVGGFDTAGSYAVDLSWSLPDKLYFDCADAVGLAIDSGRNTKGVANAVMRKLREAGKIVAEHEQRIIAHNPRMDEIMVEEADGSMNRYRKVID
tara:strand:+ start:7154 stop:7561 length:408 start_codon:yes stop_codon:yes gene_type:complete